MPLQSLLDISSYSKHIIELMFPVIFHGVFMTNLEETPFFQAEQFGETLLGSGDPGGWECQWWRNMTFTFGIGFIPVPVRFLFRPLSLVDHHIPSLRAKKGVGGRISKHAWHEATHRINSKEECRRSKEMDDKPSETQHPREPERRMNRMRSDSGAGMAPHCVTRGLRRTLSFVGKARKRLCRAAGTWQTRPTPLIKWLQHVGKQKGQVRNASHGAVNWLKMFAQWLQMVLHGKMSRKKPNGTSPGASSPQSECRKETQTSTSKRTPFKFCDLSPAYPDRTAVMGHDNRSYLSIEWYFLNFNS